MGNKCVVLPPTVNFHVVARCNYECRFCFSNFRDVRGLAPLSVEECAAVFTKLRAEGAVRMTFVGGEPTLHPKLLDLLRASSAGLVNSIVTNGRLVDAKWIEIHAPHLRWVALSCDSFVDATCDALGRMLRGRAGGHVDHVREVFARLHGWNRRRAERRQLRLKLNIVVTALNADEDPSNFILSCRPDKVKVFQFLPVVGENDAALDLACTGAQFRAYVARLGHLHEKGIEVVGEANGDMDGSYAMVDPLGRFFQRVDGRYVTGRPILEVGVRQAFADVGGFDRERFVARGGDYEAGDVADGNAPFWVAIEGLDGSGKSTVAARVAALIGGVIVTNPPTGFAGRAAADASPERDKRAWYREGNAAAVAAAREQLAEGWPVVMDRSALSTAAFEAATAGSSPVAPDLTPPDRVFLIDVAEEERVRRLAKRGIAETQEEQRLRTDDAFRERVLAAYRALDAEPVSGTGTVDEVADRILALIGVRP